MSRMQLRGRLAALAALALLGGAATAQAQPLRSVEQRLGSRLDMGTRQQVLVQVDSARRDGLPVEKLVDRALEGASKRASGSAIVASVREVRLALGSARLALGVGATPVEVETGANALEAGVARTVLAALRAARPSGPLTVPLAVLTDLVAFGVPTDTAARTVIALAHAEDATLMDFQRDVARDIGVGALPAAAASLRFASAARSLPGLTASTSTPDLYTSDNAASVPNRPPTRRKP